MKSQIKGVEFLVSLNGNQLYVEKDGFFGEIGGICGLVITATVAEKSRENIFAINVDGKKNIVLKKNFAKNPEEQKVYRNTVEVKNNGEVFHTEYPNNHLRLLVLGDAGNIKIWEIALISQDGKFFVTQQKVWDTFCYNKTGQVACPLFEGPKGWPQMIDLLKNLLTDLGDLLPISEKKKEDINLHNTKVFSGNKGIVVWFNQAQMMGVIKTTEGPARVHWTDIQRKKSRLSYLVPKEMITFKGLVPPRLTKGRKTSLPFDAVGVSPL